MVSIIQKAKLANGRSQRCKKCPLGNGRCNLELMRICSDNFIEGFVKGARLMKKQITDNYK